MTKTILLGFWDTVYMRYRENEMKQTCKRDNLDDDDDTLAAEWRALTELPTPENPSCVLSSRHRLRSQGQWAGWSHSEPLRYVGYRLADEKLIYFKHHYFYPRDAMLARVIEIATCLSVRPSRAGIVSKRRKLAAWFLHHLVAPRI